MDQGFLFIISGPSGAGKGTLARRLVGAIDEVVLSVSCTTRPPRPREVEGVDYFFISEDEFINRIESGDFLECAKVHEKWMYGTPASFVQMNLEAGRVVVLEIDVQGFREVMDVNIDKVSAFVTPSNPEELVRRIKKRAPISDEELGRRMRVANEEYEYIPLFDYLIINDDLERAIDELTGIARAEMSRVLRRNNEIKNILRLRGKQTNA